ncbi:DUF1826 domain-containing protein [Candidatus Methylospira mobilis]|nr:DUF1826 domain-containing protein [Candidatus Methylospira mobilis]WNV05543.1 DUF1826 domain-containing protein [Candidatus Methylospira mobilis]
MNALTHIIQQDAATPAAVTSNDLGDLSRIFKDDVNLCLIHRQLETQILSFAAELLRCAEEIEIVEAIDFERYKFDTLLPDYKDLPDHTAWWHDVRPAYLGILRAVRYRAGRAASQDAGQGHVSALPCRSCALTAGLHLRRRRHRMAA